MPDRFFLNVMVKLRGGLTWGKKVASRVSDTSPAPRGAVPFELVQLRGIRNIQDHGIPTLINGERFEAAARNFIRKRVSVMNDCAHRCRVTYRLLHCKIPIQKATFAPLDILPE
jgi:hypothetical protein